MKKGFFLLILFLLFSFNAKSDDITISVYTLEPGDNIYSIFGHTAIRINNFTGQSDVVYNFGTFNFNDQYFYLKFIKGNLNYFLSVIPTSEFINSAYIEKRSLIEQPLDLSDKETMLLKNHLELIYNSQERFYKYDFFYSNCATKIRDIISEASETPLKYDTLQYCSRTFRQLINPYVSKKYWLSLGINLLLGPNADRQAECFEQTFLPAFIKEMVKFSGLANDEILIYEPDSIKTQNPLYSWSMVLCIILVLLILFIIKKTRKASFNITFISIGITGLLIILVNLISENKAYSHNLNILWTTPALFATLLPRGSFNRIFKSTYLILLIIIIAFWSILPQQFSITFLPWILLLVIFLVTDLQLPNKLFSKSNE